MAHTERPTSRPSDNAPEYQQASSVTSPHSNPTSLRPEVSNGLRCGNSHATLINSDTNNNTLNLVEPGQVAPQYSFSSIHDLCNERPASATSEQANKSSYSIHSEKAAQRSSPSSVETMCTKQSGFDPFKQSNRFSLRDWRWEFSAAAFSLASFTALVGVLIAYGGKSLSSWDATFGITLNTLVATLSTLSKTALLVPVASCLSQLKWIHMVTASRALNDIQIFDDASRGPWGSLELVWRIHIRAKLAAWGSIITLLALAMSSFAQQLLSFPSRPIEFRGGTFKRMQSYDRIFRSDVIVEGMNPEIDGAISNALYNLRSPVNITCPSNCRWEEFSTLAVASKCENVTATSSKQCDSYLASSSDFFASNASWSRCNFTTPFGIRLEGNQSIEGNHSIISETSERHTKFAIEARNPRVTSLSDLDNPPNSTLVMIAIANMQGSYGVYRPDIAECRLYLSARIVRNLAVVNGTFKPGCSQDLELSFANMTNMDGTDISQDNGTAGNWHMINYEISDHHPSYTGNRTFSITQPDLRYLQESLARTFSPGTGSTNSKKFELVFYQSNLTALVEAVAQSITYGFARSHGSIKIDGIVMDSELYIKVNWPWIVLPLAEVVMGMAFMACTLIYNHHMGVTVWKSSNIIPLLTVMVGWENDELRAASLKELEVRSRRMKGRLGPNEGSVQALYRTD